MFSHILIEKYITLYRQLQGSRHPKSLRFQMSYESFPFFLHHTNKLITIIHNSFSSMEQRQPQRGLQPKVVIFTTPTCSWCRTAKQYFLQNKIRFTEVDVTRDSAGLNDMMRISGQRGVPVILINNRPILGFDKNKINSLLGLR
jgi:glutaredoxin 3